VRLVLTGFASPCKNIAPAFRDEHFVRVSQKVHPGWSRLYAKVEREGIISVGDPVRCIHQ
jgi:MOSC domain-containing protein YiiM